MKTTIEGNYSPMSPLKRALLAIEHLQAKLKESERNRREPIAIIGMSCRFPGSASTPERYWQLMREGRDAITEIPGNRWNADLYYDPDPDAPGKMSTRWGGFLDQIDQFDPEFFGIAPREAVLMDPQQRLLLDVSWEALERAGQSPDRLHGSRSGVFVGITSCDYAGILSRLDGRARSNAYFASGIARSVASGRISYVLGLQGPSISIDTACSSSLVAVHQACQSLRAEECRLALAGGVNLVLLPDYGITFSKSRMMASDGRCKVFDERADGFVRAEGCGMIVLKRLKDAVEDGDPILALILANAANQDGSSSGLTAPNGLAQEAVMREALANAGIDPLEVSYVEAHGTGTSLGDPIEVRALGAVFGKGRSPDQPLMIGSSKTNLGHMEAAAGIGGLIKVVLAIQHREIPANLHFIKPNSHIPWEELPITVPTELRSWQGERLIAGVSAFGFSGTNAHMLVASAPDCSNLSADPEVRLNVCPEDRPVQILTLSAKNSEALRMLAGKYAEHIALNPGESLEDICHTANLGRAGFASRLAVTGRNSEEIRSQLSAVADGGKAAIEGRLSSTDRPRIAFIFTGQGSQYPGMGWQLFQSAPKFRTVLEQCDQLLRPHLEKPLLSVLYPKPGESSPIDETAYTQPALFAVEFALAELWRSWGIEPAIVLGHSVGEYVAACVAGLFTLEDGLRLIAARGKLMQALPAGGQMMAVFSDEASVRKAVEPYANSVSVAVINGPENVVISGSGDAVSAIARDFEAKKIRVQRLVVSHAFHSPLMEPILGEFEQNAADLSFARPRIGLVCNVTGELLDPEIIKGGLPFYWRRHIREAVQFEKGMKTLVQNNPQIILEIGPSPLLLAMGKRCVPQTNAAWLPTLRKGREDWEQLLDSLGNCFVKGASIDWGEFDEGRARRKIVLPTYPFQRQRYWAEDEYETECSDIPGRLQDATTPDSLSVNPVLGWKLESPVLSEIVFETEIKPENFYGFAYEHRVLGRAIMPATAFIQMAIEAANGLSQNHAISLEDLELNDALQLPEKGSCRVQFILSSSKAGLYRIFSREEKGTSSWRLHGSGKIGQGEPERPNDKGPGLSFLRSKCGESVAIDAFYKGLEEKGLNFGPTFHTLQEVWRGNGEAIGRVSIPKSLSSSNLAGGIHPVQLDGCLQVLAAALSGPLAGSDYLYLPVNLKRYRIHRTPDICSGQLWSHVCLRAHDDTQLEMISSDLRIYGEDGTLLSEFEGLRLKRVRAGVFGTAFSGLKDLLYEIKWQTKALPPPASEFQDFSTQIENIVQQVDPLASSLSRSHGWEQFTDLEPRLNLLCTQYILQAFDLLGWVPQIGECSTTDELHQRMRIAPQHVRLLSRFLKILAEDGLLKETAPESWRVERQPESSAPDSLARDLLDSYPGFKAELAFTTRCGCKLAQALSGDCDPLQLLFPGGDISDAAVLYGASPSARVYNELIQAAVTAALAGLPAGKRLRILEIGGGTASTTSYLVKALPPEKTEYLFTDVSPLFAARCKEKLGSHSFLQTRTLDIEQDPRKQGIEGYFDIVVASNVVHATRDLAETFQHIQQLISPGGLLLLLELTRPQRWVDLSFGLTDGWWRFTDSELRPSYPLLSPAQWMSFLGEHGFSKAYSVPRNSPGSGALSVDSLLIAAADVKQQEKGVALSKNAGSGKWILFCDSVGLGQRLKRGLESENRSAALVYPSPEYQQLGSDEYRIDPAKPEEYAAVIEKALLSGKTKCEGIVFLWATEIAAAETGDEQSDGFIRTCGGALYLLQGLLKTQMSSIPPLWFVTKGGQSIGHQPISPLQASLWGLAKSLAWEHPEIRCTCVDLDPENAASSLEELLTEILHSDGEEQVAYRDHSRYIARLSPGQLPIPDAATPYPCRLEIENRGILDNIQLNSLGRRIPGRDEVEIQIMAAGLNFRDVLNALDMYPGDPGPLGSECAGIIVGVGEGVAYLHPGDEVTAIAPGCFGSYITCSPDLVVPKPPLMSFEESVTIPNTFLTAYWGLIHLGKMKQGDKVLIHAACGGVGLAAVQLAQQMGAEIHATAGSMEKRSYLRSLGVNHVYDSRTLDFATEIFKNTDGRGVDLVLNSLAGEFIPKSLSVLAPGGRFLEIGRTDILSPDQAKRMKPDSVYFAINLSEEYTNTPSIIRDIWHHLLKDFASGSLKPLPLKIFPIADAVSAFRFMAQARHIGKIVLSFPWQAAPVADRQSLIRSEASYLITGGFGGLGLKLAEWLADQGAKHLVLVGRRTPGQAAMNLAHQLENRGIQLEIIVEDVSSREKVRMIFDKIHRDFPPLKGIFHLAGTLDNAAILQQNWDRFRKVLAPKVMGGWWLHQFSRSWDLDHFVLFSSAASLLGSPGQANHAAANSFLDVLAYYRRTQGLPGISINWGAWSEVGAAASAETSGRIAGQGILPINPREGIAILEQLLVSMPAQMGALRICHDVFKDLARKRGGGYFSDLGYDTGERKPEEEAKAGGVSPLRAIAAQPPNKRRSQLQTCIRDHAMKVLGLKSGHRMDPSAPMHGMGLDSLMAVELRNALGSSLECDLPSTLLFDYPTIDALTDFLAGHLGLDMPDDQPSDKNAGDSRDMLEQLEQISDSELDRLFAEKMKGR